MRDRTEFVPDKGAWPAAVAILMAITLYVLLFVRFGLPESVRHLLGDEPWRLRLLLVVAAGGGVLGSVLAAWRFRLIRFQQHLSTACRAGGAAAAISLLSVPWSVAVLVAGAAGAAIGWVSVTLLSSLRGCVGTGGLGRAIGAGVGLGFAVAHVPVVSGATPRTQTIVAALVILSVSVLSPLLTPQEPSLSPRPEYERAGLIRWIVVLLTLALFCTAYPLAVPANGGPRSASWPLVFLPGLAGGAAGWWIDRGRRGALTQVAAVALVGLGLAWWVAVGPMAAAVLWAAGTGTAAVALLYFPARGARSWQAALVLVSTGWFGGLVGTLLLQSPARLPMAALLTLGVLSLLALVTQWREDW